MKRAEKFLSQLSSHKLDLEHIELMQTRIYELKSALLPSGISYDGVQVQTSPKDKFAEEMAKIVDMENQLDAEVRAIVDGERDVKSVLDRLDPKERRLIEYRHIYLYRWSVIGQIMGYSARHAQRKYKAILEKIESMI